MPYCRHTLFSFLCLFSAWAQAQSSLQIQQAWIPEAPPGATIMAGYMHIYNHSDRAISINSIQSRAFNKVEMHLSSEVNGMAKMLPQKSLLIAANGELQLRPGSYHLMLIKPRQRLKGGDRVRLSLKLSNGQTQDIDLTVRKPQRKRIMKCAAGKCGGG